MTLAVALALALAVAGARGLVSVGRGLTLKGAGFVLVTVNVIVVVTNLLLVANPDSARARFRPSVFDAHHVIITPLIYFMKFMFVVFTVVCHSGIRGEGGLWPQGYVLVGIFRAVVVTVMRKLARFLPMSSAKRVVVTRGLLNIRDASFIGTFAFVVRFNTVLSMLILC